MLGLGLPETVNADAVTVTDADIDRILSFYQTLGLQILPGSPELDCGGAPDPNNPQGWIGGLSYCTMGGTGNKIRPAPNVPWLPFPECCDTDGDGLGTLPDNEATPGWFFLRTGATSSQIGTGDVLIQRTTSGGVETESATMMPFTFATVPALVSYDDGQGDSATIQYSAPSTNHYTLNDPYLVRADPNGHVVMDLTFWRPQRRPIPPEPGAWTDIGKLSYAVSFQQVGGQDTSLIRTHCPTTAFSETDPNLVVQAVPEIAAGGVGDLAVDQPADPTHTLRFTLDVTDCLAAHGLSWHPGETAWLRLGSYEDGISSTNTTASTLVVFEQQ
jgi:hypothetical protein